MQGRSEVGWRAVAAALALTGRASPERVVSTRTGLPEGAAVAGPGALRDGAGGRGDRAGAGRRGA
ncbi:MAG TPA: hypothetical protein VJ994_00270 [Paracoccaceae bacterium]|nr:hypothetical protein [Paracoccaceae bacterium]